MATAAACKARRDAVLTLARELVALLKSLLGPDVMEEVRRRNLFDGDPNVCHSHDFCDANEVMAEAFADVTGEWPDIRNEAQRSLWNEAWNHARETGAL